MLRPQTRTPFSRLIAATLALTCVAAVASAAAHAGSAAKGLRVTSSLDGKTVLPHRVHWVAFPHLNGKGVKEITFLIDGKVRWIPDELPYTYSGTHGFLVTSFLTPGLHRFTVRVKTFDGATASDTVRARVIPAPEPPAQLAGKWQHDVSHSAPADPGASGEDAVPSGTWTLIFERRWAETIAPGKFDPVVSQATGFGYMLDSDYIPKATSFHIAGAVSIQALHDEDRRGGWWCDTWGPEADYTWSVSGDTLTLAPEGGTDACNQRGAILTGTWTRVA
jgi:hypothetical protein